MFRDEILANRLKWIKYLNNSARRKATGVLEEFKDSGSRCCLGHACHVLGLKRRKIHEVGYWGDKVGHPYIYYGENGDLDSEIAPKQLVEILGLWSESGHVESDEGIPYKEVSYESLADLNDDSEATPKEIAEYLKKVVEGGKNTPFRPLTDYQERNILDQ